MNPAALDAAPRRAPAGIGERELGEIFNAYHQPLYRYCLAILGDRQDAEDALQETMLKVVRALPGEQREIALKPWLYRVAHNESIDLLRRRRRSVPLEDSEPAVGMALADQVETRQRLRQLIADVGALPERQRGALLMRETGGLDFEEIAAALGTSQAVARQTLYEARLGLREMDAGRAMECAAVTTAISDGDGRVRRRRDLRAHLRGCDDCRRFSEGIDSRRTAFAAISPLPAVAVAAVLRGLGGGGAAAGGAGAASAGTGLGAAGAGAAKSIGTATVLKGVATVGAVVAIGVGGADLGGVIHLGHRGRTTIPAARPTTGVDPVPEPDGTSIRGSSATAAATGDRFDPRSEAPATHPATARPPVGSRVASPHRRAHAAPMPWTESDPSPSPSAAAPAPAPAPSGAAPSAPATEPVEVPAPEQSAGEGAQGHDHTKQPPAAATHGQETAAAAKAKEKPGPETGATESTTTEADSADHPEHPEHPVHPEHPTAPAKEAKPEADPPPLPDDEAPQAEEEGTEGSEAATEPPGKAKGKKPDSP